MKNKNIIIAALVLSLAALLVACGGEGGGDGGNAATSMTLPDTGQTGDYTTTFGEDSDYTINPMSYTDNGDGTILDNVTGRTWQKCSMGQSGANCATGSAALYSWTNAVNVCGNLSLAGTGWRLPTDLELMTIVHYGISSGPMIETIYFPATIAGTYWSSTTYAPSTVPGSYDALAWSVSFSLGRVAADDKTWTMYVRCVR
jgi:hypothetical protein